MRGCVTFKIVSEVTLREGWVERLCDLTLCHKTNPPPTKNTKRNTKVGHKIGKRKKSVTVFLEVGEK